MEIDHGQSASGSVEADFTVNEGCDEEKSPLSEEELGKPSSPDVDVWDSHLPGIAQSPTEQDMEEDSVWVNRTTTDIPPRNCAADKPEPEEQEDSPGGVLLIPSSSPPPPPPIDVIAIDMNGGHLQMLDDVGDQQSLVDDEYCHSPLGGAMPESDDSDVAEFVFP